MTDEKAKPNQTRKVERDARAGKFIVVTPEQQQRIEHTIVELEKASRRIDEARRLIRRPR
jgi:hypothetical protein